MNAYVIAGVVIIAASVMLYGAGLMGPGGPFMLAIGGILVAVYGAFAPDQGPKFAQPRRGRPSEDHWV
jgi:hypothetical protein